MGFANVSARQPEGRGLEFFAQSMQARARVSNRWLAPGAVSTAPDQIILANMFGKSGGQLTALCQRPPRALREGRGLVAAINGVQPADPFGNPTKNQISCDRSIGHCTQSAACRNDHRSRSASRKSFSIQNTWKRYRRLNPKQHVSSLQQPARHPASIMGITSVITRMTILPGFSSSTNRKLCHLMIILGPIVV